MIAIISICFTAEMFVAKSHLAGVVAGLIPKIHCYSRTLLPEHAVSLSKFSLPTSHDHQLPAVLLGELTG